MGVPGVMIFTSNSILLKLYQVSRVLIGKKTVTLAATICDPPHIGTIQRRE